MFRDLLTGAATRQGYALLLRNLLPCYVEMERGLERHRSTPGVRQLAFARLSRAPALERDLAALAGADWRRSLPTLEAGAAYGRRIREVADRAPARLIGHAYVRYLGDLSGGQILRKLLAKSLGLEAEALAFYDFSAIGELAPLKERFRAALDRAADELDDVDSVVAEAAEAFALNIDVSEAAHAAARAAELAPSQTAGAVVAWR
jgi:heme oxygenase